MRLGENGDKGNANFQIVVRFILCRLGEFRLPLKVSSGNKLRFAIVDLDGERIDKLLIERQHEEF